MLGVRLDPKLDRLLAAEARRRRVTKSEIAREAIRRYLAGRDLTEEAREQSRRASAVRSEFLGHDDRGWNR
jgi:RHH-type rel operon transcriptional repressor/antitoxin RelB